MGKVTNKRSKQWSGGEKRNWNGESESDKGRKHGK